MSQTNTYFSQLVPNQSTPKQSQNPSFQANAIQTIFTKNYFKQGTYKKEFRDYYYQIGFTSIIVKTLLAPLQRWKIIQQTQNTYPLRPKKFKNFMNYIKRIPKQQGYLALWRGNASGIILYMWQTVFQIGVYDNMKNYMRKMIQQQQQGSLLSKLLQRIMYPIFATVITQAVTYPIDVARVRLTMNYEKERNKFYFNGIRTALAFIREEEGGVKSMYRGFLLSNALSFLHLNVYLSLSTIVKYISIPAGDKVQQLQKSAIINTEAIIGTASLILIYPIDTMKKIIQLNNNSKPILFHNVRGAYKYMQREASLLAFFNGLQVSIVKSLLFLPLFTVCQKFVENGSSASAQNAV